MEEERKNKIKNKKQLDKKHKSLYIDDDSLSKKHKNKEFKNKKQKIQQDDYLDHMEFYKEYDL
jgi:hypothetical protein